MLKEQRELLAAISAAHRLARKLHDKGVKISGIVQKLRAAGEELDARVRAIEKGAKSEKKAAPDTLAPPATA